MLPFRLIMLFEEKNIYFSFFIFFVNNVCIFEFHYLFEKLINLREILIKILKNLNILFNK